MARFHLKFNEIWLVDGRAIVQDGNHTLSARNDKEK